MFILESKTQPGVFVYESDAGPSLGYVEFKYSWPEMEQPYCYVAYQFTSGDGPDNFLTTSTDFFEVLTAFGWAKIEANTLELGEVG